MKKTLLALAAVVALGTTPTTFAADSVGAKELANTQELIAAVQKDKRQVVLATLQLNDKQLAKFTPVYDEYQAESTKLYTAGTNLSNRLFVADFGGMTDAESKDIMAQAFKLREERLKLLKKYADKLDKQIPAVKVFQFVQVENKIQALLDVAAAASIPIVTKTPGSM
ncbi:MAG: hypothetical protein FIB04_06950 [Gammaproteobacteria bacterium]|nr:hypothetical protein [Gammaproteobacteria bacterium]